MESTDFSVIKKHKNILRNQASENKKYLKNLNDKIEDYQNQINRAKRIQEKKRRSPKTRLVSRERKISLETNNKTDKYVALYAHRKTSPCQGYMKGSETRLR